jgi:Holliday junction DNA helicase RuvB
MPVMLPPFTLLAATTDEFRLAKPLRDRFQITLRLEPYGRDELEKLLRQRIRLLQIEVEDPVPAMVAQRSKGTPRIGLRLLESCRRVAASTGERAVSEKHAIEAFELAGLDDLGLDAQEQKYLKILAAQQQPLRLGTVAARLGMEPTTVSKVIEPFLVRENLLARDERGRALTDLGRKHACGPQPEPSDEGVSQ